MLVNAIAPVITETDLFKEMTPEHIAYSKSKIPMGRFLQIPEIAALVAWMAGPECTFTTGFTFDISGGRAYLLMRRRLGIEDRYFGRRIAGKYLRRAPD